MLKTSKILSLFLTLVLIAGVFVGCTGVGNDGKIKIVCSVFAEYDWVRNIVGDSENVEVTLLVSGGQELHSYEATPADVLMLKTSDIVVSVGGASDEWISDMLDGTEVKHVRLTQIEGITLHEVSAHSDDHDHDHGSKEIDEHIWLSLKNAAIAIEHLCAEISELDPNGAEKYNNNTKIYLESLVDLDKRMTDIATDNHTLLFADRFPFVYFLEDYGIKYHAAFEGCSSDIGWTPETAIDLASRLDASEKRFLFVTESSDRELATSVIGISKNGGEIVSLNSMQAVSTEDVGARTYVEIMSENVATMEHVFGR